MSEMRWNPLLEEWVVTATHRQERTFLPPPGFCPLCPTKPGCFPTEVPAPDYEIVVFENKFPTFQREPHPPAVKGSKLYPVRLAKGICEVVLYSPEHNGSLTKMKLEDIHKLVLVWKDRYRELGSLDYIDYVFIFENRGEEIGVTLTHPHGQIYAFPYIPPVVARELASCLKHRERTGLCLLCDILREEKVDERRIVAENELFLAMVPFYARYPHEVHIIPKRHCLSLLDIGPGGPHSLAWMLKNVLLRYDGLYGFPLSYMMVMHQAPTDGKDYSYYHFHIEFYSLRRSRDKLKYRAGCESGAGTFIADALPEDWAAELRDVPVQF